MLLRADARTLPLADASVDCVVTSPPYWGLRDYGTATWAGGEAACQHGPRVMGNANKGHVREVLDGDRSRCYYCGAHRIDRQIGLEPTPEAYVAALVGVGRELWRVLRPTGTLWLNLGDSYTGGGGFYPDAPSNQPSAVSARNFGGHTAGAKRGGIAVVSGLKPKDLAGIPWRVAFALQADGWYLRSDIIWAKPNPMPESVGDRPTKAHEYIFLLAKGARYYYDAAAIAEATTDTGTITFGQPSHLARCVNGQQPSGNEKLAGRRENYLTRNARSVWTITTEPYPEAHFATFPPALAQRCVLAGCPLGGLVLDPFIGSGTVGAVAERLGRRWVGVDLTYQDLARARTAQRGLMFSEATAMTETLPAPLLGDDARGQGILTARRV